MRPEPGRRRRLGRAMETQGAVMAEKRSAEQISAVMRKIKSKDSKAELALRKELWRRGLRYRKNCPQVFGLSLIHI